tara:strand:+ start:1002 stop:2465 length:1464 start_codon:yes stop_codon:yes gene_type:complete
MKIENSEQEIINQAIEFFKKGNYHKTLYELKKLETNTNNFLVYWYLGHTHFKLHSYSDAIKNVKKSIELNSKDPINLNFLGEIYLQVNKYQDALKLFEEVLGFDPKNNTAILNLAKVNLNLGRIENSEKYFKQLHEKDPLNFSYLYSLISINKKYLTNELVKNIRDNEHNLNYINSIYSKLIMAKLAQFDKNYNEEINYLLGAHKIYSNRNQRATNQQFNYYKNLLPKFLSKIDKIEINNNDNLKPIFIMGLPRSGTTLLEKIVVSGKETVEMGGETDVFDKVFFSKQIIKNYDNDELFTDFIFDSKSINYLRDQILGQYKEQNLGKNNLIFTDKSISNFLYIELIQKLFPNSKIIYCYRNPLANLIGLLRSFLPNMLWSHSLDNIFEIFNLYLTKLKQIKTNKSLNIKVINLEDLSKDPEKISKDLYNFLDLQWSSTCIHNNKENLIFKTASNLQVRNEIVKHDLKYTKNYLNIFKELGFNFEWLV